MRIGINASFLRKPGTGIGQVTLQFLQTLAATEEWKHHTFFLYLEEEADISFLPSTFHKRVFLPRWWNRDDVPRKWLWEKFSLPKKVIADKCDAFISISQSATVFQKTKMTPEFQHVMVVHDLIPRIFPEYLSRFTQKIHWQSTERAIRKADTVLAVSENTKKDLASLLSIPENDIQVAYPAVAPLFLEPLETDITRATLSRYGLTEGYIYHGGGLEKRKNTEMLLRAYASVLAEKKDTPRLVISGRIFPETNPLAAPVKTLIEELKLEEKVVLLDFVPEVDLPHLYQGALFFAYPSLYEGFGLPVLEALTQGTPVLAGGNASLPEVAGASALYVDPTSAESIASGLKRMVNEKELREKLISQSRTQAVQFSWERFVGKVMSPLSDKL